MIVNLLNLYCRFANNSKGTWQENFTAVSGCFMLSTGCVMALGMLKKEESEDDKILFSPCPGSSL